MVTKLGYSDQHDLFKHHMGAVLKKHLKSCPEWGAHTHQAVIFATLVKVCQTSLLSNRSFKRNIVYPKDGGRAAVWFSDQILQVFEQVLSNTNNSPPELQIRIILALARTMVMTAEGQKSETGFGHTTKVLGEMIILC